MLGDDCEALPHEKASAAGHTKSGLLWISIGFAGSTCFWFLAVLFYIVLFVLILAFLSFDFVDLRVKR